MNLEMYSRTTEEIYYKEVVCWEHTIVGTITNSSGDYGYGPEIERLKIKHIYPSGAVCILYEKDLIDESFNQFNVNALVEAFAKVEL